VLTWYCFEKEYVYYIYLAKIRTIFIARFFKVSTCCKLVMLNLSVRFEDSILQLSIGQALLRRTN